VRDVELSVIIPSLNSLTIDKTLDSVKGQTHPLGGTEIIVVGLDGPALVEEDGLVRFISTGTAVCAAAARNIGMEEARGQYFVFIDSDCVAEADWIERLMARHLLGEKVVAGGVAFGPGSYWALCDNVSRLHEFVSGGKPRHLQYAPTLNLSVSRQVVREVGGFNEGLRTGEDIDWTMRVAGLGHDIYFEPSALVYHSPDRNSFSAVMGYAVESGFNMAYVRLSYPEVLRAPSLLRHQAWLLILSPVISLYATAQIYFVHLSLRGYLRTLPIVYLSKVAWCLGAARRAGSEKRGERPRDRKRRVRPS
jgi:glycosyltransferase involved in cell wall biosynthesis